MEIETAIEILENDIHEDVPKVAVTSKKQDEAVKKAIEALKKQIPKKVKESSFGNINYYKCHECGEISGINAEYCSCCGQKLEWED